MEKRPVGRPTDNPKRYQLTVKYDDACKMILQRYCIQEDVSMMEAVRRGVHKLEQDLEE